MNGNVLKRARDFLGFTQAQMAEGLGISLATYQRREALAEESIPPSEATHVRVILEVDSFRRNHPTIFEWVARERANVGLDEMMSDDAD